ncbi:AP-5 complex subunit mu-1-like isoform X2 [Lytechinus pictus]|uniref:AP-5 complex subunit mu-1-like isoform X2 n=1 Tax=Lytechinus pictus TaxID=7653 RepID=UPI0030B9F1D0
MALRAIWVIPLPGNGPSSVLFSRTYPTVEKRAKIYGEGADRNDYVKIPNEIEIYKAVIDELGLQHPSHKFIDSRDSCDMVYQKPIFELTVKEGKLWPVIMIEKFGLLYICLPVVELTSSSRPPLIDIPGVSMGFSLLFQMAEVVGALPRNVNELHPKVQELYCYLSQAAPFGSVVDSNPTTVKSTISGLINSQSISAHTKQPAWRPVVPKTKPQIHFAITEQIRAVLYNRPDIDDVYQLYGTVTCKADLEGAMPEVSMNLAVPPDIPPLENLIIHPCVAATDPLNIQPGEVTSTVRKFHFNPPSEMFILCHYTATAPSSDQTSTVTSPSRPPSVTMARSATPTSMSRSTNYSLRESRLETPTRGSMTHREVVTPSSERSSSPTPSQLSFQSLATPSELPIKAAYEMTGDEREVQVKLRLKLSGSVKNSFEYFEVQIPFFNRGVVVGVDVNPSIGSVVLSQDRHRLGWNLGQKLPSRSLEASLQATVQFGPEEKDVNKDSFCVGLNTYASIFFKVSDYTHSGCKVDTRSVQIKPSSKVKVTSVREFLSVEYKVWNSQGDALSCLPPVMQET